MEGLDAIRRSLNHWFLVDLLKESSRELPAECAEKIVKAFAWDVIDQDIEKLTDEMKYKLLNQTKLLLETHFDNWYCGKGTVIQIGTSVLRSLKSYDIELWRRYIFHELRDKRPLRQINFKKIIRYFEDAEDSTRFSEGVQKFFKDMIPLIQHSIFVTRGRHSFRFSGSMDLTEFLISAERLAGLIDAKAAKSDQEHSLERLLGNKELANHGNVDQDIETLLDEFTNAWVDIIERHYAFEFLPYDLPLDHPEWYRYSLRGEAPASVVAHFDLWSRKAESMLGRVQPALVDAGFFPPIRIMSFFEFRASRGRQHGRDFLQTFDKDWLQQTRKGVAAWQKGGSRINWNGNLIPYAAPLRDIVIGKLSLASFLWSMRQAKPSTKWRKTASQFAKGAPGSQVREALTVWLRCLTEERITGEAISSWRMVCRLESIAKHAQGFVSVFDRVEDAALVHFFAYGMKYFLLDDGPGNFAPVVDDPAVLSEGAVTLVRAAIWMLREFEGPETVYLIRDVAMSAITRVTSGSTNVGYRSLAVANAAILALGEIGTVEAVAALGRIRLKVRDQRLAKQILQAMEEASQRSNMSIAELEELAAPACGLEGVGITKTTLGSYSGELLISAAGAVSLTLRDARGKELKAVPSAIKDDASLLAEWKALKAQQSEIEKAIPVEVRRIEASWLSEREIAFDDWCELYLDHPLVGTLARRLIWLFRDEERAVALFPIEGEFQNSKGVRTTKESLMGMRVRLWHPLDAEPFEVRSWQDFVLDRKIVQPFKQAHREVYLLTEPERVSETYSNRFAGHILRQNQSVALARLRGWRATLRISADRPNDEVTHRVIREHGLSVEYWTSVSGGDDPEFSENLTYLFIATDRVCFRRLDPETGRYHQGALVPLTSVPPRVFSETMRDVDLFVGVASIGNDPEWIDRGRTAEHPNEWRLGEAANYWRHQSTAELNVSGHMRRDFLEKIVPMLRISAQCSFDDRNLIVKGTRHVYRIHIGSGSIFIENNRYLCIVPAQLNQTDVFLPFEGDGMLSIILSKAFILANDADIKDNTILRQL